jgi:hypothetical protein
MGTDGVGFCDQGAEVVEGIDLAKSAGVDQAHEQVSHLGTVLGFVA